MFALPCLSLWSVVLQCPQLKVIFHEDNQTMIRIMVTGVNQTMRYMSRTHRIPIAWMHEVFQSGQVLLRYETSAKMAADIYTKAFNDTEKWTMAQWLINVVEPDRILEQVEFVRLEESADIPPESEPSLEDALATVISFGDYPTYVWDLGFERLFGPPVEE